jgi:hypothetical protein
MKRGILIVMMAISAFFVHAQTNCDSTVCFQYADTSSFQILGFAKQTESSAVNPDYYYNCQMLCEIEAARSINVDLIVDIQNYKVLIYKREEGVLIKEN